MEISNATFQYLILAIVGLAVLLIVTLIVVFATGVGKRVVQRIKQRWRFKHGKHVNVIFLGNNHVSRELFIEKEKDGSFKINDVRYAINPLATFLHDGIPTQINHEGIAEPYNIFNDKATMRCSSTDNKLSSLKRTPDSPQLINLKTSTKTSCVRVHSNLSIIFQSIWLMSKSVVSIAGWSRNQVIFTRLEATLALFIFWPLESSSQLIYGSLQILKRCVV